MKNWGQTTGVKKNPVNTILTIFLSDLLFSMASTRSHFAAY